MAEKFRISKFWVAMTMMAAVGAVLFIKILDGYLEKEGLVLIDWPVNRLMVRLRMPVLNQIMLVTTMAGSMVMVAWGGGLSVGLLTAAKKWRYLKALLISLAAGALFTQITKYIVERPRPPVENALIEAQGYAFPSGHSYFAMIFYGMITYFWIRHFENRGVKLFIAAAGSGLILAIAFSRIYLGVHWATDVLAGLAISGSWLAVAIMYMEYKIRYFTPENRQFDRRLVWGGFWLALVSWLAVLMVVYWQAKIMYGV